MTRWGARAYAVLAYAAFALFLSAPFLALALVLGLI